MPNNTSDKCSKEFPSVIIITNDDRISGDNVRFYDEPNTAKAFNAGLDDLPPNTLVTCLSAKDRMDSKFASDFYQTFVCFPLCKGIYTDNRTPYFKTEHFPHWSVDVLINGTIINTPLVFWSDGIRYDEELEHLFHYDFLIKYGLKHLLFHYAEPAFICTHENTGLEEEIKKCQKRLNTYRA